LLERICRFYSEHFGDIDRLPSREELSVEDALRKVSSDHPGLLPKAGQLAVDAELQGAAALARCCLASRHRCTASRLRSSRRTKLVI